jgi:hypothetical protein
MNPLPFVDEHGIRVKAPPRQAWTAVQRTAYDLMRAAHPMFSKLWRLEPASGFSVAEETAPRRLALRGQHRFATYELTFDVDPEGDAVTVKARTWAAFPGIAGKAYRALVIGSGGHALVVRSMLKRIARDAAR